MAKTITIVGTAITACTFYFTTCEVRVQYVLIDADGAPQGTNVLVLCPTTSDTTSMTTTDMSPGDPGTQETRLHLPAQHHDALLALEDYIQEQLAIREQLAGSHS